MSNYVNLSSLCYPQPVVLEGTRGYSEMEKSMKCFLQSQLDKVLCDSPDLIVFPECANRYSGCEREELANFYTYIGNSIEEYLKEVAIRYHLNIAYSAVHLCKPESEKPFCNSIIYIDRNGQVSGTYHKNHLVIEENTLSQVAYGTEANVVNLDFGRVASAICFDLNFDELLFRYKKQKPNLIVFSSMYHGGLRQAQWAYTCRSYFIGAIKNAPGAILNPYGEVVAHATNYTKHLSARVNLDYALCHLDYNREKLKAAKQKYKDAIKIYDPGYVGSVMISCEDKGMCVTDILREFELETLDEYLDRAIKHRDRNISNEYD